MPAGVEATLQQLQLGLADDKQGTADSSFQAQQQQHHQQQHADQQEQLVQQQETPAALQNTACLAATFAWLDNEQSLVQCSAVCQLWHSVLQAEDIWRRVYLRSLPEPAPHEWVGSYKQQFQRLHGLLNPAEAEQTGLKGSALCYNAATGNLVSYNARQRIVSVLKADGSIRSEVAEVPGAAGSAHRPLLASTGSELVVLAAADGALQLWDATDCTCCGILGQHSSFVTSLSVSGHLVASTCSSEMRLWDVEQRMCLFRVPIGLQLPTPTLEPHVEVCHQQQLLALANCAAPAPSSIIKVYSTHPAPPSSRPNLNSSSSSSGGGLAGSRAAATTPAAAQAAAAAVSVVGDSSCPGAVGALLLKELPVNAASDMKLVDGLLIAASNFHARGVSSNSPFKSERAYTVVISIWETRTWQQTRLMSPRLWTDTPQYSMQGLPIIQVSQGIVYCATLRPGSNNAFPSCCVYAMQLPADVIAAGARSRNSRISSSNGSEEQLPHGSSGSNGAATSSSSGSRLQQGSGSIGTGAMAQGRIQVATVGGIGPVGYKAEDTVMLSISDRDRQSWVGKEPIVDDTGGRLTVLLTTPTQLVTATENGQIFSSRLLPQEQQQQQGGAEAAPAAATAAAAAGSTDGDAPVGPVVHVLQPHAAGSRFIALDL